MCAPFNPRRWCVRSSFLGQIELNFVCGFVIQRNFRNPFARASRLLLNKNFRLQRRDTEEGNAAERPNQIAHKFCDKSVKRGTEWGSVVTWGSRMYGGDSSGVAAQLSSGVQSVTGNAFAFAAVKSDGSVVTWGDSDSGGDSSGVAAQLSSGVQSVVGNGGAFAAVKSDGSVVTWGRPDIGGDSSRVAAQLSSGVQSVTGNGAAFAAVKSDGQRG